MPRRATNQATSGESSVSSYLRSKTRVPVRKRVFGVPGPWLVRGFVVFIAVMAGVSVAYSVDTYLRESNQFVFAGPRELLHITGLRFIERQAVEDIFQADIGSSVYDLPLEERRKQIQQISWSKSARIRRIWPNRVWVHVDERQPVAFVRLPSSGKKSGPTPRLIDDEGVLLDPPPENPFSFPVLTGISSSMPLAERRRRVALYLALISDLDGSEPYYSSRISEVDVLDARNAKVATVFDGEYVQLQMGDQNFRHRFEIFLKYFQSWKKELGPVRSVDLRYKGVVATK